MSVLHLCLVCAAAYEVNASLLGFCACCILILVTETYHCGRYQALPVEEQQRLDAEQGMRQ